MRLPELHRGTLLRRYKRFLADVELSDGQVVVAHCPNPGRMTSCAFEGGTVWLSHHPSPKRKLKWSWELALAGGDGTPILVNTARPNAVVIEALQAQQVPELAGYATLQTEVKYGERSRVDVLLSDPDRPDCYVEVKSVTLRTTGDEGAFPDAVSARATRHLHELVECVKQGHRAVLFFLVSRGDVGRIRPADEVDPVYGEALRHAHTAGVELLAYRAEISIEGIRLGAPVPIELP